ncbi:hypothetical protein [Bradyrhizobium diazoefficiens]|uniref:hypothetical protein n=1 Tax=Bradyrhizobium diazoefficiens TaxID=1355477 RepID=UPI00272CBCCD|nr:hypothetical protein [Bradyrhizobium diazoefficiens]WLA65666.1 hypothetical protein QNN01_01860 [Bradyrhizobium diazoefficiens]
MASFPDFVDVNGAWDEICARLYEHFERTFKCVPRRTINGKPLVFDGRVIDSNLEEGFWHVVTAGKGENRLYDPDRARRICWIADILDGKIAGVSRWVTVEGDGTRKLYYWLEQNQYVIIFAEKPKVVVLVTAFCVNQPWTERDLGKRRASGEAF